MPHGLAALEVRLAYELELLGIPGPEWVTRGEAGRHDVVVIGAGMCGLVAAFALVREGVRDVRLLDARPPGQEGPWLTYARMRTLRSPKHLTGPALGVPSLTFRAWHEAQWGSDAWQALGRIPRSQWMDYLVWYRRVLDLPVENSTEVHAIEARHGGFDLHTRTAGGESTVHARKVVLATGREGLAQPRVPGAFAGCPSTLCRHASEAIDFDTLAGRRVAVVGLGASALDNVGAALEAGAAEVHLLARAVAVPRINKAKQIVYAGFTHGFPALPEHDRAEILAYIARCRVAPPRASLLRVADAPGFRLHLDAPVLAARVRDDALALELPRETLTVDAAVLATGFRIDVDECPLLDGHAPHIARWWDAREPAPVLPARGAAAADEVAGELAGHPRLGPAFEFTERVAGAAPWLADMHCFNHAAAPTHGNVSSDIPAVSAGAARLARGICRQLFVQDAAHHRADLERYDEPELEGNELQTDAWWPPVE